MNALRRLRLTAWSSAEQGEIIWIERSSKRVLVKIAKCGELMNNCSLVAAYELDASCAGTLGAVRLPQRE